MRFLSSFFLYFCGKYLSMSEQNLNEQYRDDEIDLRKLFQAIGNGFINIGNWFVNLIIRFRRVSLDYKVLIIGTVILGAILGAACNKVNKPYFSTSMLISSLYFNTRLFENNIKKLNVLCEEEERTGLSKLLSIDIEEAKNIKGFFYEPLVSEQDIVDIEVLKQKLGELKVGDEDIQKIVDQLYIQNKRTYILSVSVFDNSMIEDFQEAIISYLRDNPFVKNRIRTTKINQQNLIAKLKADINQLDSLKHLFNLNMKANANRKDESTSNNVYVGESGNLNPTTFYNQSIDLYKQLQKTETALELGTDFEVRDSFTVFTEPSSPSIKKEIAYAMAIFLGLAYALILLVEINKYLSRVEKERF